MDFVRETMLAVVKDYQRSHKIDLARETSTIGHKVLYWLPLQNQYQVEVRLNKEVQHEIHATLEAGFDAWRECYLP